MNTSTLPQDLMTNSLVHFEKGVPINDLQLRGDQKRRLTRVDHVYWQWRQNPLGINYKALFRQLVKGHFSDPAAETRAAQKDILLFEYIKETFNPISRNDARAKIQFAAEKTMRIGAETDNVMALTKGGDLLYKVAGLDKPDDQQIDMSKMKFIDPVVVTDISKVDGTKENVDDAEMKRIMEKYNATQDNKLKDVDDMVQTMEARSGISESEAQHGAEDTQSGQ